MEARLEIAEVNTDGYHIVWYIAETQDYGATLGENFSSLSEKHSQTEFDDAWKDSNIDQVEHLTAENAVVDSPGVCLLYGAFFWETLPQARIALRLAKAAITSARANRPLQDWQKQAIAAGWTPPKRRKVKS